MRYSFALTVLLCACSSPSPETQLEYDLTSAADRAKWTPIGLEYRGSVGPYAVYVATGTTQRFIGPRVLVPRGGGAMIMGAKNYFTGSSKAPMALLSMHSDKSGTLCTSSQPPEMNGGCTAAHDDSGGATSASPADGGALGDMASGWGGGCVGDTDGGDGYGNSGGYGNPGGYGSGGWKNPGCGDMGTGGGGDSDGGMTGGDSDGGMTGGGGGGASDGGMTGGGDGGTSADSSGDLVTVDFERALPVGSTIVIRKLSLGGSAARTAPNTPSVCCNKGGMCTLTSSTSIQ